MADLLAQAEHDLVAKGFLITTVNSEDLGRVIGRSGRTARALRTVVGALADAPVRVDVVDTDRR